MKNNQCGTIIRMSNIWSIPEFAALWCGVHPEDIDIVLQKSYRDTSSILKSLLYQSHDYPCLKPRIQFIIDAIREGRLEACDELGRFRGWENISWSRMSIRGDKAKEWIEYSALPPDELPEFIFKSESDTIKNSIDGLEEAKNKIKKLEDELKIEKSKNYELSQQIIDKEKQGPVNAARWENSCRAMARAYAAYINNIGKKNITKNEFLDFMSHRVEGFTNTLITVEEIAWKEFPEELKHGTGRPSYDDLSDVPF
ncbi:hypothetical protein [Bilophila wadsworthia]|uniref:hypothetical protein n=1 Tax=Bilophila wadsworthia TaxID=35833 RepID=UPI001D2E53AB|nr:hypothetical protein [Bilophila wadsworthia]MBS5376980.1 hypothetical protein [Bilophila wadsworthia]